VKFSSVVSIQIFSVKNANPSFYEIHVENDYFPLPFKFEMEAITKTSKTYNSFIQYPNNTPSVPNYLDTFNKNKNTKEFVRNLQKRPTLIRF
jgi:hypothetical protein